MLKIQDKIKKQHFNTIEVLNFCNIKIYTLNKYKNQLSINPVKVKPAYYRRKDVILIYYLAKIDKNKHYNVKGLREVVLPALRKNIK